MDAGQGMAVVEWARESDKRERYKHEWDAVLPVMHAGFVKMTEFSEYVDRRTGANIDQRPTEEIIADLERRFGREL